MAKPNYDIFGSFDLFKILNCGFININVHVPDLTYGIELKASNLVKFLENIHTTIGSCPSIGAGGASINSIISIMEGQIAFMVIIDIFIEIYTVIIYFNFVIRKLISKIGFEFIKTKR